MSSPRLAVLCDYPEEGWPSMDLAAEMLLAELGARPAEVVRAERVCPPFRRRLTQLPVLGRRGAAVNADRLLNRLWDYPRYLRRRRDSFELFHLCDHSYAQLVHVLPAERTGIFCHDLDTFRCVLEPSRERRPRWFRAMVPHLLRGFRKAAVVFHTTDEIRRQIVLHGLIDPARLVKAPLGPAPEFHLSGGEIDTPARSASDGCPVGGQPFLLHVGSCIPRKRVDILLEVFAAVRARHPDLQLVQAGGQFTPAQLQLIERHGISAAVAQLRGLERRTIAELYRRARLVLQPSEAEGFGLPVLEALTCGAAVVASDLPALREVGGTAVTYCPVADVGAWAEAVGRLLADPAGGPDRADRLMQAGRFSWAAHAQTILQAYQRLLGEGGPTP